MGVNLGDIYDTMQVNLGSLYVNDFTKFGKTYQVIVQADAPFRADAQAISALKTRNAAGEMVPLGALMTVEPTFGPTRVTRYNGYPVGRHQRRRRIPASRRARPRPRSRRC